jgi:exoribonuclease II
VHEDENSQTHVADSIFDKQSIRPRVELLVVIADPLAFLSGSPA